MDWINVVIDVIGGVIVFGIGMCFGLYQNYHKPESQLTNPVGFTLFFYGVVFGIFLLLYGIYDLFFKG